MPLIDLLRHKTAEEKAELERLNDEILELFGKCKRPADHRKLNKLLKRQGEILGWEGQAMKPSDERKLLLDKVFYLEKKRNKRPEDLKAMRDANKRLKELEGRLD